MPPQSSLPEISPDEVEAQLSRGPEPPMIVDVREPDEWVAGHIAGALHIPLNEIPRRVAEIPADRDVVVVCHLGGRSAMATAFLRRQGYTRAVNLRGGMDAWEGRHLPIERGA